jgi:hypothetical protein
VIAFQVLRHIIPYKIGSILLCDMRAVLQTFSFSVSGWKIQRNSPKFSLFWHTQLFTPHSSPFKKPRKTFTILVFHLNSNPSLPPQFLPFPKNSLHIYLPATVVLSSSPFAIFPAYFHFFSLLCGISKACAKTSFPRLFSL